MLGFDFNGALKSPMTDDDETIYLRATVIGGKRWPDDYTVIWRGLTIGRIMLAPGLPRHVPQWRWTCNFYGKPGGGNGSGSDLDDCKLRFRATWASVAAGLTTEDIARAHEMRRG
jgi:hypothetical protein